MTKKEKKIDKTNLLFGLNFFGKDKSELLMELEKRLANSSKTTYIVTPNPEQVVQSSSDHQFLTNLQAADFIIPDGIGIIWASWLLAWRGKAVGLPARIAGVDLVVDLLELARVNNLKVMVLGGRDYGILTQSNHILWLEAYQDVNHPSQAEETRVLAAIKQQKPDLLFLAFGAPAQEQWAREHLEMCHQSGVKLVMVVGGAFDYILGKVPRAPKLVRQLGGEWLFRLVRQPWRWRRQTRLISFISLVLKEFFS